MPWGPHRKPGPPDLPPRGSYGSQDWNQRKRASPDSFTYLRTGFIDLPRFEAYQLCWEKGRASPLDLSALACRYNLITCKATSNAYETWGYRDFFSGDTEVQEAGSTYAMLGAGLVLSVALGTQWFFPGTPAAKLRTWCIQGRCSPREQHMVTIRSQKPMHVYRSF